MSSLIEPNEALVSVKLIDKFISTTSTGELVATKNRIGLAGLYPNHPDILVQHPCALSDDNNGATLTRAGVMRTHFPSNLQIGEADGDAPV
jgi:hypothetical protein